MTTRNVNVELVDGAWTDGSSWARVITALKAEGVNVVAAPIPLTSLADDVLARLSAFSTPAISLCRRIPARSELVHCLLDESRTLLANYVDPQGRHSGLLLLRSSQT
jgi:hypothetical protein